MSSNSIQLYPLPRTLVLNARGTRTKPKARIGKSTHTQIHRILDVGKQEASNRADNAGGISQHNIKSNVEETRQNGKLGNSNGTLQYYDIDVTNHNNNNNNNYNNNNSNNNIGQSKSILSTNKLKTAQRIDRKQTKTVLSQNLNKPCKSIQKTNPN